MIVANVVLTLFVETTVTKKVAFAVGTILRARVVLTWLVRTANPTIIVLWAGLGLAQIKIGVGITLIRICCIKLINK